jgi:hypothetical protein
MSYRIVAAVGVLVAVLSALVAAAVAFVSGTVSIFTAALGGVIGLSISFSGGLVTSRILRKRSIEIRFRLRTGGGMRGTPARGIPGGGATVRRRWDGRPGWPRH